MVIFENVSKNFAKNAAALDSVSFSLERGEFIFLVGHSGAGKTTLLRLITRELLPTSGRIVVDDIDIAKLPKGKIPYLRRKITMVFQDFKVLMDRTAFENVSLALEILNIPRAEIQKQVEDVIGIVGLSSKQHLFPSQLSAGELQRLSIARAVVGKPAIILADEPTGNLDPKTGWEILKLLSKINQNQTTIIMATHNTEIVNSMKKRVIALEQGKIIRDEKTGKYH